MAVNRVSPPEGTWGPLVQAEWGAADSPQNGHHALHRLNEALKKRGLRTWFGEVRYLAQLSHPNSIPICHFSARAMASNNRSVMLRT